MSAVAGTDYWSLGIFLYECLHGTTPFAAKNYLSTYKKIAAYSKHGKLKWHTELSSSVQNLIQVSRTEYLWHWPVPCVT